MENLPVAGPAGLKRRLFAVFFAVSALSIAGGAVYHAHHRAALRSDAERLLLSVLQVKLGQLSAWREERLNDTASLVDSPVLSIYLNRFAADPGDRKTAELLRKRLENYLKHNRYSFAALADPGGRVLVSAGSAPEKGCPEVRDLIAKAGASGRPEMGGFYIAPGEKAPHLDVAAPAAVGPGGKRLFLLLRVAPTQYLYPFLQAWSAKGETGEILLVGRSGGEVVFLNDLLHVKNAAMRLKLPVDTEGLPAALALKGFSGLLRGRDYRGADVLAAVSPVPQTDWALVAKLDWAEVMRGTGEIAVLLVLLILALPAAAGAVTFMLFRSQAEGYQADVSAAKASLALSEDKFRLFFENSPLGKSITGLDGSVHVNKAFCDMLGYTEEELRGKKWQDLTPPEDVPKTEAMVRSLVAGARTSLQFEKRYVRKDGGIVEADVATALQRNAAGRPAYLITTISDITGRKRAEEALRASETAVRSKLNAIMSPEGDIGSLALEDIFDIPALQQMMDELCKLTNITSAILDIKGKVLVASGWQDICTRFHRVNPETCRHCLESDTLLTKDIPPGTIRSYFCKNNLRDIATPLIVGGKHVGNFFLGQFLYEDDPRNEGVFREQARRYGFDEKEYLAAYGRIPVFSREKVEVLINFYRQVSELISSLSYGKIKLARALAQSERGQELLRSSEARFKAIFESTPFPAMVHAEDGEVVAINKAWEEMTGYTRADIPTIADWTEKAYGLKKQPVIEDIERLYGLTEKRDEGEYRIRAKSGEERTWYFSSAPLGVEGKGRRTVISMANDVTERKLLELEKDKLVKDLAASKQEMENFLYITTHDLRSPLVNIQGFSQNLEHYIRELKEGLAHAQAPQGIKAGLEKLAGEKIPAALEFVLGSSRKMDALISALLKVSRVGRVEMKPERIEMSGLLRNVLDAMRFQLEEAGAEVKAGVLPPCKADPVAVNQAFSNLLDNAVKYRDGSRRLAVEVSGEVKGDRVLYTISDNGPGIPGKDLERIWNVFYSHERTGQRKGEGIGLPMVRRLVEKNGGSITAGAKEGQGTVFYIEFPAAGEEK